MIRIAMLSKWHVHAEEYAKEIRTMKDTEIVAVWDELPERGNEWAAEIGVEFEADINKLLRRKDIDAVVINAPTVMHKNIMIAAAKAGKHIFTEKIMAMNVEECEMISNAVKKTGVKFCISLPHMVSPANLFAKRIVEEKIIGEVTFLRVRIAHGGAIEDWLPGHFYDSSHSGGGAMIDLGAHPMYLSRWLLGKPVKLVSLFNSYTGKGVEDNAACLIEYENKSIAVVETGFISPVSPDTLEMYGTQGALIIRDNGREIKLKSKIYSSKVSGWVTPDILPEKEANPMEQWIAGIKEGKPIKFGLAEGMNLTEMMEAAYISYSEGKQYLFK